MPIRPIPSEECTRACEWVSLRLDTQLSDFESVLLDAHLARCADCRAFAQAMTGLTDVLRAAPLEEPSFSFQPLRRRKGRISGLRAVSVAAVAAVVGLSGLVSLQLSGGRAPRAAVQLDREVIALKERQMEELDTVGRSTVRAVVPGVAAAEQITIGATAPTGTAPLHEPAEGVSTR